MEEEQEESQKSLLHQIAPDSLNSHHIRFLSQSSHHDLSHFLGCQAFPSPFSWNDLSFSFPYHC